VERANSLTTFHSWVFAWAMSPSMLLGGVEQQGDLHDWVGRAGVGVGGRRVGPAGGGGAVGVEGHGEDGGNGEGDEEVSAGHGVASWSPCSMMP
jgi:hypothetical protein